MQKQHSKGVREKSKEKQATESKAIRSGDALMKGTKMRTM